MAEYNKLTKELLSQGYTADNYPDYVKLPGGCYSKDPLQNIYGGFEYQRWYCHEFVYKTGCGKYILGENVLPDMGYMGIEWTHENDNPVIRCPYDKAQCEFNNPILHGAVGGGLCIQCWCECHQTQEKYDYENSFEKADKERHEEAERKYKEYAEVHHGRVCRNHMFYNERTRTWKQHYEPSRCAQICYSQDGYCPILGKQLSKKRGNVYYDLKTSGTRHDDTLFNGEQWTNIEKGIRYFDHPISMDICEAFVKTQSSNIYERLKWDKLTCMQLFDKSYTLEVLNIQAESKPSRDLMQDLQDIKAGIRISHATDTEKLKKEKRRERRQLAKQRRTEKLEKKILEVGYWNLEDYSLDKVHADKWLSEERLMELEIMREQRIKAEKEKPVQLSLFDTQN